MTPHLTRREREVVQLLCDPTVYAAKEAAYRLGVTEGTLKRHLVHIYAKLGMFGGSVRVLVLWALAHSEELGIPIPTPEMFAQEKAA